MDRCRDGVPLALNFSLRHVVKGSDRRCERSEHAQYFPLSNIPLGAQTRTLTHYQIGYEAAAHFLDYSLAELLVWSVPRLSLAYQDIAASAFRFVGWEFSKNWNSLPVSKNGPAHPISRQG